MYYTCKTAGGWLPKARINDATTADQFMPSLAFDSAGSAYVGFYDRREDPANIRYKLYGARASADGVALRSNFAISTNPNSAEYFPNNFIGDYTRSWWHSIGITEWLTSFIGQETIAPGYFGDVFLGFSYY